MATNTAIQPSAKKNLLPIYFRAVAMSFEMALRHLVMDAFVIFTVLIQPLIVALLALWMMRDKPGDHAIFVVVGSGLTGLWSGVLFISGNSITSERWTGTLETLVSIPTPIWVITIGKNLANVLQSLISMVAGYFLAALLFGYDLTMVNPGLFIASVFFVIISFVAFGLLIAPIFLMNPAVQSWQNGLEFPVYILSGFLFPVALLPGWTTPISWILAPYWAAKALHGASSGLATPQEIAGYWGIMLVLAVVYGLIASRLFGIMLRRARIDGTLGVE